MSDQQFVIPAAPILLPLWLVLISSVAYALKRRGAFSAGRLVLIAAFAAYAMAVLAVTLLPLQVALGRYANQVPWYEKLAFIPVVTIDLPTFVLNIVMTAPLGALAPLLVHVPSLRRAALLGFLVSLSIELTQALTNILLSSGRTADVNDLLANTLGTALGWYALSRLQRLPAVSSLCNWLRLPSGTTLADLTATTRRNDKTTRPTSDVA